MRRFAIRDALFMDLADHLAAAIERRHRGKVRMLAIEYADAGRAVQLVPGKNVEIAIKRAYIDIEMHRRLTAVDQDRNSPRTRQFHNCPDRNDRSQGV